MLQTATLQFLKQLAKNNNREWFETNRQKYESAKTDFIQSVQKIIDGFCKTDASLASVDAKQCIFRINRDIRFSKDKSPYKINFAASINAGGKKSTDAGYYLHIEPGKSFIGGGMYQPTPDALRKIRQEIDYNFDAFQKIINNKKFKAVYAKGLSKDGELSLSRPPKGYDENNAAIEFLKLKSFIALTPLTDEELTDKKFTATVIKAFEALQPLITFLNEAAKINCSAL